MKELADTILTEAARPAKGDCCDPLEHAAKKWAMAALDTWNGEILCKALRISACIVDFIDAMKTKADDVRD